MTEPSTLRSTHFGSTVTYMNAKYIWISIQETKPSKPYIHKNHLLHTAYVELIFKFLAGYFLNLYFSQFWQEELSLREGKDFMHGLSKVFYLQTEYEAELDSPSHTGASSHWSLLVTPWKLVRMVLPLLLPTAAGPGCHTAPVKGPSARQRTDTEQGNAENLLQHGNWGHYSAGSRCKRSPRTQTPTIKTQSQHGRGTSGCTVTNPPRTRGSEQDGQGQGHLLGATTGSMQGKRQVQGLTEPWGHPTPSHALLTLLPGLQFSFNPTLWLPIH